MKNILKFALSVLLAISCSPDDPVNPEIVIEEPSIIGTWSPVNYNEICSSGYQRAFDVYTDCVKQSRYVFSSNSGSSTPKSGNLAVIRYDEVGENCEVVYDQIGTWRIESDNLYLTFGSITETMTIFDHFSHRLKFGEYTPGRKNVLCHDDQGVTHYYTEFKRESE